MTHQNKHHSRRYLALTWLLIAYALCLLIAPVFDHDISWVWVFYGLMPTSVAIGFSLHSYYKSSHFERHSDRYLHQIASDMSDVKLYVQSIVGIKEFDE